MTSNPNLRAAWRFRVLVIYGLILGLLGSFLMLYRVAEFGPPPKFTARDQPLYVTQTQLLVDSSSGPYLRTTQLPIIRGTAENGQSPTTVVPPVEPEKLINAANLYPLMITSDEVALRRHKLIGPVPGSVTAKGLHAFQGNNRFRPAVLPIIQIQSIAPTPRAAYLLAQGTYDAFHAWLAERQRKAGVPPQQRIILTQLNAPLAAVEVGGPSYTLPAMAALAIFFAFCGLAVMLDRWRPVRLRASDRDEDSMPPRIGTADDAGHPLAEQGGIVTDLAPSHASDRQ